jgi:hypothetical protein
LTPIVVTWAAAMSALLAVFGRRFAERLVDVVLDELASRQCEGA